MHVYIYIAKIKKYIVFNICECSKCVYVYIYIYIAKVDLDWTKKKNEKTSSWMSKKNLQSMPQNFPPKTLHGLDSDPLVIGSQEPRRSRV